MGSDEQPYLSKDHTSDNITPQPSGEQAEGGVYVVAAHSRKALEDAKIIHAAAEKYKDPKAKATEKEELRVFSTCMWADDFWEAGVERYRPAAGDVVTHRTPVPVFCEEAADALFHMRKSIGKQYHNIKRAHGIDAVRKADGYIPEVESIKTHDRDIPEPSVRAVYRICAALNKTNTKLREYGEEPLPRTLFPDDDEAYIRNNLLRCPGMPDDNPALVKLLDVQDWFRRTKDMDIVKLRNFLHHNLDKKTPHKILYGGNISKLRKSNREPRSGRFQGRTSYDSVVSMLQFFIYRELFLNVLRVRYHPIAKRWYFVYPGIAYDKETENFSISMNTGIFIKNMLANTKYAATAKFGKDTQRRVDECIMQLHLRGTFTNLMLRKSSILAANGLVTPLASTRMRRAHATLTFQVNLEAFQNELLYTQRANRHHFKRPTHASDTLTGRNRDSASISCLHFLQIDYREAEAELHSLRYNLVVHDEIGWNLGRPAVTAELEARMCWDYARGHGFSENLSTRIEAAESVQAAFESTGSTGAWREAEGGTRDENLQLKELALQTVLCPNHTNDVEATNYEWAVKYLREYFPQLVKAVYVHFGLQDDAYTYNGELPGRVPTVRSVDDFHKQIGSMFEYSYAGKMPEGEHHVYVPLNLRRWVLRDLKLLGNYRIAASYTEQPDNTPAYYDYSPDHKTFLACREADRAAGLKLREQLFGTQGALYVATPDVDKVSSAFLKSGTDIQSADFFIKSNEMNRTLYVLLKNHVGLNCNLFSQRYDTPLSTVWNREYKGRVNPYTFYPPAAVAAGEDQVNYTPYVDDLAERGVARPLNREVLGDYVNQLCAGESQAAVYDVDQLPYRFGKAAQQFVEALQYPITDFPKLAGKEFHKVMYAAKGLQLHHSPDNEKVLYDPEQHQFFKICLGDDGNSEKRYTHTCPVYMCQSPQLNNSYTRQLLYKAVRYKGLRDYHLYLLGAIQGSSHYRVGWLQDLLKATPYVSPTVYAYLRSVTWVDLLVHPRKIIDCLDLTYHFMLLQGAERVLLDHYFNPTTHRPDIPGLGELPIITPDNHHSTDFHLPEALSAVHKVGNQDRVFVKAVADLLNPMLKVTVPVALHGKDHMLYSGGNLRMISHLFTTVYPELLDKRMEPHVAPHVSGDYLQTLSCFGSRTKPAMRLHMLFQSQFLGHHGFQDPWLRYNRRSSSRDAGAQQWLNLDDQLAGSDLDQFRNVQVNERHLPFDPEAPQTTVENNPSWMPFTQYDTFTRIYKRYAKVLQATHSLQVRTVNTFFDIQDLLEADTAKQAPEDIFNIPQASKRLSDTTVDACAKVLVYNRAAHMSCCREVRDTLYGEDLSAFDDGGFSDDITCGGRSLPAFMQKIAEPLPAFDPADFDTMFADKKSAMASKYQTHFDITDHMTYAAFSKRLPWAFPQRDMFCQRVTG